MRISDWSSDVCSSDLFADRAGLGLQRAGRRGITGGTAPGRRRTRKRKGEKGAVMSIDQEVEILRRIPIFAKIDPAKLKLMAFASERVTYKPGQALFRQGERGEAARSEEHTSELQSLMRSSYAVFCL